MRRGVGVGLAVFLALAAPFFPGRARACELALVPAHTVDPAQVGVDQTPPQLAQPTVADLQNLEPAGGGCQQKCGWEHSARLTDLATDDLTPVDRIGYRVTLVAGPAPGPTTGRTVPVLARPDGLTLFWDGDDDFDFTMQLIAIDAAGNESAPRTVQIASAGGGCSVGHRRASDGFALAVLALALALAGARARRSCRAACLKRARVVSMFALALVTLCRCSGGSTAGDAGTGTAGGGGSGTGGTTGSGGAIGAGGSAGSGGNQVGGASGSGGKSGAGGGAGTGSAGHCGMSVDAGTMCNSLDYCPAVATCSVIASTPTPTGGTILPGLYEMRSQASVVGCATVIAQAFRLTASGANSFTGEARGFDLVSHVESSVNFTYAVSGVTIDETYTCGAFLGTLPWDYSVVNNNGTTELHIIDANSLWVYARVGN